MPRVNQKHYDVLKYWEVEETTSRGPLKSTLFDGSLSMAVTITTIHKALTLIVSFERALMLPQTEISLARPSSAKAQD